MGVWGIAWATVIAYFVAAAILCVCLCREKSAFKLYIDRIRFNTSQLAFVLKIGMPAGIQGAVFAVSNVVIQGAVNGFGSQAVAGSAAALNYELITYFVINAFASCAVTFVSQNYAAGNYEQCRKIVRVCLGAGMVSAASLCAIFVGFGAFFLGAFTADAVALTMGLVRLQFAEAFEFLPATYEIPAGALRGMGCSAMPAAIVMLGTCGIRMIWIIAVFPMLGSFESLILVFPLTWVLTGTAMLIAYRVATAHLFGGAMEKRRIGFALRMLKTTRALEAQLLHDVAASVSADPLLATLEVASHPTSSPSMQSMKKRIARVGIVRMR